MTAPVVAASYAEVRSVLRSADFDASGSTIQVGQSRRLLPLQAVGVEHDVSRARLARCLSAEAVAGWEPSIRSIAEDLTASIAGQVVDVNSSFSVAFPLRVFGVLLGIPRSDLDRLLRWHDVIMDPDCESPQLRNDAGRAVTAYFESHVRHGDIRNDDNLLGALMAGESGDKPTMEDVVDTCYLLLLAAVDTVSQAMATTFALFAADPKWRQVAVRGGRANGDFIDELLRWAPPARIVPRTAIVGAVIDGTEIPAGGTILCDLGAANRDPRRWVDPSLFDPGRPPGVHLAFGAGRHRCVGANLARREIALALEELDRHIESITSADDIGNWEDASQWRRQRPLRLSLAPRR